MTHLLIIGGSDAGISAVLLARELAPEVEVTMVVTDRFPNVSICGIPYFRSGEVAEADDLTHRKAADIDGHCIRVVLQHSATRIVKAGAKSGHSLSRCVGARKPPWSSGRSDRSP